MRFIAVGSLVRTIAVVYVLVLVINGQFEWQAKDNFDDIDMRIRRVSADNCKISSTASLYLPEGSVSHLPDIKDFDINPQFPNRSNLVLLHNMALTRSFFWSYVLQTRFIRPAVNDTYDPGMHYYFLSTIADVSSNPIINASAIYFAPNMSYSPSYRGFFNKTFPRFAPRTFRADDYNDPVHLERTSSMNTFVVSDLGAFKLDSSTNDYTSDNYQINEWYKKWLPDVVSGRHDTKTTYRVEIRYANNTNETFSFHGPLAADEFPGPLQWTRPYFDCGRSNKWVIAAVVPIADIYPRHTGFRHIEYPRYTAASVLELDFDRIDINQCPISEGNTGPNIYAGTTKCKEDTTECEPLDGWGFRRGGYQCRCHPGYRLPFYTRRPYLGEIIERSTEDSYKHQFHCLKIDWLHKIPVKWEVLSDIYREQILLGNEEYRNSTEGITSLHMKRINVHHVLNFIRSMDPIKCLRYEDKDLILPGEFAFNADKQFINEARMAVRLANFISAFLQINDPGAIYSEKRLADKSLTEDQMIAETVALVIGNSKIQSAGMYWDRTKFTNRTFFAPFAYKKHRIDRKFYVDDLARLWNTSEVYTKKSWFRELKRRWSTNYDSLDTFTLKIKIRHNEIGEYLRKFENYPAFYRAAKLEHGMWSEPFYDCKSKFPKWIVSYAVPFFGFDRLKARLEFKGVIAVNFNLLDLDINQCPGQEYEPNKFKNTHKCDRKTSTCVPLMGRGYDVGGCKCECIQGYEYPFEGPITYYDGELLESEFWNLVNKQPSRYDMLKCRVATATNAK